MTTFDEIVAISTRDNRVCPKPQRWNELFQLLPNKIQKPGGGWVPPLPLILSAWWDTPDISKASRLREHIEWACENGALGTVHSFLSNLLEDEWHHFGE